MTNIQKLRAGRKVSRAEYEQAKAEYQEAYQNADENTKAILDGLMRSSQNYSSADPMNNRSSREYATQIYRNAVKVANGEYSEPLGATASTKNMFNGYSHDENQNNANWLTSKYLNKGKKSSSTGNSGSQSSSSSSSQSYYSFKWADGLGTSYGLDTDTFQDRYGRFVDNLIKNVNNAIVAKQSGKVVRGLASQDADQLEAILQGLVDLKNRSAGLQQNDALRELLKFAGPLKIDENGFKSYFSTYLPQQTQSDKNKQARINEGYQFGSTTSGNVALDNAIRSKGWNIGQLGNKRYIFDSDFNLVTTPEFFVDDDYASQGYNQYYNIGADGSLNIGNTDEIIDQNHPYYQNYQNFLTKAKERNGSVYGVNGAWDNLNSQSDNELLRAISQEIHGKKWIDVGRYFNGDQSVIAVPKDGQTVETDRYGNLKFDNLDIYYIGPDKQVHKGTKDEASQALGGFNRLGYDQTSFISAENYNLGDQQSNIDINSNYSGRGWFGNWWARFAGLNLNGEFNPFYALSPAYKLFDKDERHAAYSGNIADNPEDWAKLILDSIATDTNKELLSRFNYQSDPMSLAVILNTIIQETGMELTPEQKEAYQMLLRRAKSKQSVSTEKEGGVLKAAEGNTLNIFGEPSTTSVVRKRWDKRQAEADAVAQRAAERGVSDSVQVASEKQGMTPSDWARVAALTMDIGSTIAAISQAGTGLFGTATSDALALGSMGVDLVADITDPSVTAGEAAKNAVINTGLGLVGFAGGGLAKLGRNLPKIAKIVTKVVAYGGAALTAMNPDVQASVKKVMESGKPGQSPMTTKDWQNVMMFLRAASGTTRGIATRAGQVKQVKRINSKSKGSAKIESTESVVDPGQEYIKAGEKQIKVTKAEKAKLEEALASKENPQAKFEEVLKTIKGAENLTPEEISSIDTSKGKLFGLIKPKVTTEGGNKKPITQRVREKIGNTAGGITDKIAGTYKTNATDAELAGLMERADTRAAAARRNPETLSWTQRLLMKSDAALGRAYTGEQIALARAANEGERYFGRNIDLESSDKTNGTTENFRQKLQARAEAKAASEAEAAKTKTNANEAAVGTPERVKLKKEEVKDVADKVNTLVSKRISKSGKYKGNNKLASKEFTELKNLHEDLAELAADPDVSSNPELMAKVRAAQQALESAKIQFSGARSELWNQFGFKQGGEINSKYSHLRK